MKRREEGSPPCLVGWVEIGFATEPHHCLVLVFWWGSQSLDPPYKTILCVLGGESSFCSSVGRYE